MSSISDFALFRAIVDAGGISAGALALESSPPAVSRRLAALEARLGVQLADRRSRRFKLTDEGLLLYERSCTILEQVRDAEAEVASRGGAARGLLRVGAPVDFGRHYIAPAIAKFTSQHPGLEAHLVLSDAGLEVDVDACDLVLRFGLPDDQTVIAKKIAATKSVLCASPGYIERRGQPQSPAELASHNCLRLARRHKLLDLWKFEKNGHLEEVKVSGTLSSASGDALHDWAISGEGLSLEAYWDIADDLASGRLVTILDDYTRPDLELYAIFAPGHPVPPRIRLFIEFLTRSMITS